MTIRDLPLIDASLNALCTCLLLYGYYLIRNGRKTEHRNVMLSAFAVSVIFLICYLVYHFSVGSVPYQGQGWLRPLYFTILISHILLAVTVPVLAILTLWRAFQERFDKHRKIARITFPIWLYVSITGVIVYLMLYIF
ncbi:DUF420 domain-containing protein [Bryobacter aggregatus]|uniref:DUF420 domain-containing protein n=1 Tax=Bryobacter aggregatus TaxID=360054 RepID=UPI0004E238B2|nr:DUF420 domain-containing protein [Bryobacter aggregatus]